MANPWPLKVPPSDIRHSHVCCLQLREDFRRWQDRSALTSGV